MISTNKDLAMFGLGTQEILIILAVALIIFGPKKLPEIGRALGQGLRELRKASRDIMDSIERDDEPESGSTWTSDQVSNQPSENIANTNDRIPATAADETTTVETETGQVSNQEKESACNVADSDRD
jgi:TatA/E family protein of Tat protein translocase